MKNTGKFSIATMWWLHDYMWGFGYVLKFTVSIASYWPVVAEWLHAFWFLGNIMLRQRNSQNSLLLRLKSQHLMASTVS